MYEAIKPALVIIAVSGAASYFVIKAKSLWLLLSQASGEAPVITNIGARIRVVLVDVLGQASVRRGKPLVGIAHTLIFWGFIIITVGTFEMIVEGIFHGANLGRISEKFYGWYLAAADVAIVSVLLGVAFGFYRRFILKPHYLTNGIDAKMILVVTAGLMLSLLGMNIFKVASFPESSLNQYFIISGALADALGARSLPGSAAFAGMETFYWLHLILVLGFLVYIPNSKHLHILAAAPNLFFKHLPQTKAFTKTNFENENATSFGLGTVKDLSWKGVLDLYACTECGRCEEACPAAMTGKPLSPKKIIHDLKIELLEQKNILLGKTSGELKPIVRDDGPISPDVIWSCTSCRACESNCPVGIEQLNPIIESRRNLVQMESKFPAELQTVFRNLENNFAPWAFPHDSRAEWCQSLGVKQMAEHPTAEVLYYVGCAGSFDDRAKKVATAIVKLLQMANVDFAILGKEEKCNGDPARRAGNEYLAQMLIQENVAVLNKYKPRKILAACPHCFNTLKNEYPAFGAQYDVVHHSTFLLDLLNAGKIPLDPSAAKETITYHDSCYLGRWNGVYEAPRKLLAKAGVKIDEMERSGQKGLCCGAGGARMFLEENIGKRVNVERTEEALAKNVTTIAANCPFCTTMLTDGLKAKDKQNDVVVKDIAEILLAGTKVQ